MGCSHRSHSVGGSRHGAHHPAARTSAERQLWAAGEPARDRAEREAIPDAGIRFELVRPLGRGGRRSMDPLHARLIEEIQLDVGHPLSLSIRPYPMLERERTERRHGERERFIPNRRSVAGGWRLVASRSAIAVDDL